jgi:hypothetical protein
MAIDDRPREVISIDPSLAGNADKSRPGRSAVTIPEIEWTAHRLASGG